MQGNKLYIWPEFSQVKIVNLMTKSTTIHSYNEFFLKDYFILAHPLQVYVYRIFKICKDYLISTHPSRCRCTWIGLCCTHNAINNQLITVYLKQRHQLRVMYLHRIIHQSLLTAFFNKVEIKNKIHRNNNFYDKAWSTTRDSLPPILKCLVP